MHSIFYILLFSFTTVFGFATNLHLLSFLGIDTAKVLDVRAEEYRQLPHGRVGNAQFVHPSRLYPPLYALAVIGWLWTAFGWSVFHRLAGSDAARMVEWRAVPAIVALVALAAIFAPMNGLYRKERMMFLRSLRRIIFSPIMAPVPFCDIILADILTSSAKVLGELWVSGCLLFTMTERIGMGGDIGEVCARGLMVPIMTSLPYIFRFRQCMSEVLTGSTPTPRKSLMNAAKYASAFPVIVFSAMQTVIGDPFDEEVLGAGDELRWIGRSALFKLWIFAVLVNSLYSFWWDVTNDWGLSLLVPSGWSKSTAVSYAFVPQTPSSRPRSTTSKPLSISRSRASPPLESSRSSLSVPGGGGGNGGMNVEFPPPPSRPQSPGERIHQSSRPHTRPSHSRAFSTAATPNISYPFLRPILLLPDPTIYYLAIAVDLILRFTWSIKLSSHLHSIQEIESGIILMEALEVLRRWMWVYLRIEWEAVRKGGGGSLDARDGEMRLRAEEEDSNHLLHQHQHHVGRNGGGDVGNEENIGLGILTQVEGKGKESSSNY